LANFCRLERVKRGEYASAIGLVWRCLYLLNAYPVPRDESKVEPLD
jgi:hypothetical protein